MSDSLLISQVLLWILLLTVLAICVALTRQIGVLYERIAPMGALMMDDGPKVGDRAPADAYRTLTGEAVQVGVAFGEAQSHATLLFFVSPTCPVCKKLLPIARRIAQREADWLRVVLASDGEQPEHLEFERRAGLQAFPYLLSPQLGLAYRVSRLPYAVLISETGVVQAKGLVNSREQFESLFTARELGVASVQDFLAARDTAGAN
ncbi:MAG: methylamine dehydrogenase accessory protein MauD [Cupriavidus sp.]|nr:methylamine dehydrogenase accessory protein MauD [Cupriavidus sp.]